MNVEQLIHNWLSSAQYELDSADVLLDEGRYAHCLALSGKCLEKMLKALWLRKKNEHPPTHSRLLYFAGKLDLGLPEWAVDLLAVLTLFATDHEDVTYWKELRRSVKKEFAEQTYQETERFIEWLKPMLWQ